MSQTTTRTENPAEFYERYWVPTVHGPFAADLIERVDPRPDAQMLDVACGTGVVTRATARRIRRDAAITGLDINPLMLAVAREEALTQGIDIDCQDGNAEALQFAMAGPFIDNGALVVASETAILQARKPA